MLTRQKIVEACRAALAAQPAVRAAFLAGSEAFGRADQYSDIDLNCVAPLAETAAVFASVEGTLAGLSPIALRLEMPPSAAWPGLAQRFYRLRDTSEFLMIDFCILTGAQLPTFLEPQRHGVPVVLFDHDGLLKPAPHEPDHDQRLKQRLAWLRASFPMFQNLVRKAVLRGDMVEAMAMYHGHTLRPLVDALRVRHCPARFDYGFRYTGYDLPAPVVAELGELMMVSGADDLLRKLERARELWTAAIEPLDAP